MKSVVLKQKKPFLAKLLGVFFLGLTVYYLINQNAPIAQLLFMPILGFVLLGYSVTFEISSTSTSKRQLRLYGFVVWSSELKYVRPEYVSVFSLRSGVQSDWGPVAAIGRRTSANEFVVRFFSGNSHFTVMRTSNQGLARAEGRELADMFSVELLDKS
ncbi:hypothetical protein D1013_01065 [Euzebyella marina]|uniref:Uncharacterized protein n=1 Tax=Euzebyella marina TaxID=1761453 RepID=A0A3G2L1D2_9FLAO|nr:hypothetical protein [Euzebyella marina]AYN66068.1 hypothetical protein D1013_01065 [Euzebyella marina]